MAPPDRTENDSTHVCDCSGTSRTLVVVTPQVEAIAPELFVAAASFGWTVHRDIDVLEIPLRARSRVASLADVIAVLQACVGEYFTELRAIWLPTGKKVTECLRELVRARPLRDLNPTDAASPIVDILEHGRIETWFQPVFLRRNGLALWGYECLMRGRDAADTLIQPGQLLEWAEREHLLPTLDRICRERHIENAARAGAPAHCTFLINFLPTVIYDPKVCLTSTRKAVERSGLEPQRIIFEVVETHRVTDTTYLRKILDEYRAAGFGVALDDVGGGYSGLTLMGDLSPDLIKIDRALVTRAPESAMHRTICAALVAIGHDNGKLVLAEGVETAEEWAVMQALDVDLVQGFRFGRPAPEPALESLPA
jgi:EAL domain-containing protein (putative c-di-GMP-specific phosphodiesterase class I)